MGFRIWYCDGDNIMRYFDIHSCMSHVILEADPLIDITDYLTVAYLIILDAPEMN